jgi:tetratricopeptide (TPR) repeat protein
LSEKNLFLKTWHRAGLILLLASAVLAFLAWRCLRDPKINFLPSDGRAEWIVFPSPLDAGANAYLSFDAVFEREFTLDDVPRVARLYLRGAKRIELRINRLRIDAPVSRNWKDVSTVDVSSFLQTGTNLIAVRVFNDNGPPALWLRLESDRVTLRSDRTWQTSFAGSAWRSATLASIPRAMVGHDPAAMEERTFNAFLIVWPIWAIFGGIALFICSRQNGWRVLERQKSHAAIALLLIATLWALLFLNNAARMPVHTGFDVSPHLEYIKYVQERHTLPLPNEGFEMFQPPLYYVLSAVALSSCGLSITSVSSVFLLRSFAMLLGIAHFTLVFFILRLLFPRRFDLQLCGLLLAAFVPMQLYMSHYATNETLGAVLVTASLYLGLRILKNDRAGRLEYVGVGFSLGLAILAKATGVLLFPFLVIALAIKVRNERWAISVRNLAVMLAVCFAVCGWQYLRIGLRADAPFFGVAGGFSWWQDPGYHTPANYFRFGRALIAPFFSGSHSFADGIYSTLWGDGLWGGQSDPDYRPPWNYDLMAAGYLLALVPTAVLLAGVATAIGRFVRKPSTELFLLLGLSAAVALALVLLAVRVPSFAQGKAFYGLSILAPLSVFAALGWQTLTRGRRSLQTTFGIILLMWLMNSFASFWIRDTPFQKNYVSHKALLDNGVSAAAPKADEAVTRYPSNANAREFRALVLNELGRAKEALAEAERATELAPADASCYLQLSLILARESVTDRAVNEARRALELAPANPTASEVLSRFLLASTHLDEAIDVAQNGLAVSPFDAQLHFTLAEALARKNDFVNAANQFAYASIIYPERTEAPLNLKQALHSLINDSDKLKLLQQMSSIAADAPVLLDQLAWWFSTHPDAEVRNGAEAVRFAERSCQLTNHRSPLLLCTLAAAYAETRRFPDAVDTVRKAMFIAQSSRDQAGVAFGQELLASFQAQRPYRADPNLP